MLGSQSTATFSRRHNHRADVDLMLIAANGLQRLMACHQARRVSYREKCNHRRRKLESLDNLCPHDEKHQAKISHPRTASLHSNVMSRYLREEASKTLHAYHHHRYCECSAHREGEIRTID